MEDLLRSIYQERASHPDTLGILLIEKRKNISPNTDKFDYVLLVVTRQSDVDVFVKHYVFEDKKAALYVVKEAKLNEWLLLGNNRKVMDWVISGKAVFDRNEYITDLKSEFNEFPKSERKLKIGIEFSKLIRRYIDGKDFFESKHYLDAYNHIVHALHHLGRLSLIEQGFHPEVTVWHQLKQMDPQIYKLYQELVESEESIEKRLELLFLATDFLISSKVKVGASYLMEVLSEKREPWAYNDILGHPKLELYSIDLGVLLEFLVEKQLVKVERVETKRPGIYHRYYSV